MQIHGARLAENRVAELEEVIRMFQGQSRVLLAHDVTGRPVEILLSLKGKNIPLDTKLYAAPIVKDEK